MVYWIWFALAAVLLVLEVFAPGAAFLWFGLSGLVVGALKLAAPEMPLWLELLTFGGLALGAVYGWKRYRHNFPAAQSDLPLLNQRDKQLIGRTLTLETAIQNGRGQARVNDSLWLVEGPELDKGSSVLVVGANGTLLIVEASPEP